MLVSAHMHWITVSLAGSHSRVTENESTTISRTASEGKLNESKGWNAKLVCADRVRSESLKGPGVMYPGTAPHISQALICHFERPGSGVC